MKFFSEPVNCQNFRIDSDLTTPVGLASVSGRSSPFEPCSFCKSAFLWEQFNSSLLPNQGAVPVRSGRGIGPHALNLMVVVCLHADFIDPA